MFLSDYGIPESNAVISVFYRCRFGGGSLHPIAAALGGWGAHELIKLITAQYVPLNNALVYNGITQNTLTLTLGDWSPSNIFSSQLIFDTIKLIASSVVQSQLFAFWHATCNIPVLRGFYYTVLYTDSVQYFVLGENETNENNFFLNELVAIYSISMKMLTNLNGNSLYLNVNDINDVLYLETITSSLEAAAVYGLKLCNCAQKPPSA